MAGPPPCTEFDAMRCVPDGKGKREQCRGGMWVEAEPCALEEVCAGMDTTVPGTCLSVAVVCAGKKGRAVCDGEGTLYHCDANEVIERQEACGSAELCQPATTSGTCAKCVPGKARCEGKQLERCDVRGETFAPESTCATVELCDADGGRCKPPACEPEEWVCKGDELYSCNKQQTELTKKTMCGPGLCNARMQTCVQCATDGQCPDSADGCQEGTCRGNVCGTTPARDGKGCGGSNVCRGGTCCTPNCRNKCGGVSDGCGGTCNAVCPPRCGNGVIETGEICDGNCPTSCSNSGNPCRRNVPRGLPCNIVCTLENVETGVENECGGCGRLQVSGSSIGTGSQIGDYCQVGMGACFATGKIDCQRRPGNTLICTARGASPTSERCNGIDDNCDGLADNAGADASCGTGMRCASGLGTCEASP